MGEFARTNEDPKWTAQKGNSRADFSFRDGAGEGWYLSMYKHDANGTVVCGPLTCKLCLPKETLEWGKQYKFSLFEAINMPDGTEIPESFILTITPAVRAVQESMRFRGGRGSFLSALAERHTARAGGEGDAGNATVTT